MKHLSIIHHEAQAGGAVRYRAGGSTIMAIREDGTEFIADSSSSWLTAEKAEAAASLLNEAITQDDQRKKEDR
jgi:hypothetical protein